MHVLLLGRLAPDVSDLFLEARWESKRRMSEDSMP